MRILIVKLSALGDVVQALAVLPVFKTRWPEAQIYWLVEEAAADLVKGHPLLHGVFVVRRKTWFKALTQAQEIRHTLKEIRRFVQTLRAQSFDIILDLQGLLKSGLWVALSRGKKKIGFANNREGSSCPLSHPLPPYDPEIHAVWRYLDAACYLTGQRLREVTFPLPPLPRPEEVRERLNLTRDFAVFVPGARWKTKLWIAEGWANLAQEVRKGLDLEVLVVGGPGDEAHASAIRDIFPEIRSLCGRTSILELAAVLKMARLIVTVDTGPMHLAAALGKRVVALFGPTAPWRTGPFGLGHRIVRLELPCSPCFRKTCPEPYCLQGLSPERVFREVQALWVNGGS